MTLTEYLTDYKRALAFGKWLYFRQTAIERATSSTIEDNGIGFNQPDILRCGAMLRCVTEGVPYEESLLRHWVTTELSFRLGKYKKQYKEYLSTLTPESLPPKPPPTLF